MVGSHKNTLGILLLAEWITPSQKNSNFSADIHNLFHLSFLSMKKQFSLIGCHFSVKELIDGVVFMRKVCKAEGKNQFDRGQT